MRKLCDNAKAAMFKAGREYWYIVAGTWFLGCINSQSEDYNATNALVWFEQHYGKATNFHKDFKWL